LASSTGKPLVVVVTGTSGAGKGTLEKILLERMPDVLELAVSATTRERRPTEADGREYYFLSEREFERLVAPGRCAPRSTASRGTGRSRCSTSRPTARFA